MAFRADFLSDGPNRRRENQKILLVEDSRMFSSVLSHRFQTELGLSVTHCASLRKLNDTLAGGDHGFTMAVVDLNLPDSPHGETLDVTIAHRIPTVVFTASFDVEMRNRIMERSIVDYVDRKSVV